MSAAPRVRPLALAIIRRDNRILVFEAFDRVKQQTFYRPLGGGIEFGERGHEAIVRELREEIGATVTSTRLVGILENLFVFEGTPGHEIVLLYDVTLAEELPEARIEVGDEPPVDAVWMPLGAFADGGPPLYPDGLYELLATSTAVPRT